MGTLENDKIIAEFLGLKNENGIYRNGYHLEPNLMCLLDYTREETDLHFDDDWNWLMEVIDTIKVQTIEDYTLIDKIDDALICIDIKAVYAACLEFIKWYNKNGGKKN